MHREDIQKEQDKVTIIVPVYNAEKTLKRLLDSLCRQTYENMEIILVDDGSFDDSASIMQEYAERDDRFRLLLNTDKGVARSRNIGIEAASGKYLQFADADDWLEDDAVEQFVKQAKNYGCDMVISDFRRVVGSHVYRMGMIEKQGMITRKEFAEIMMKSPADFYYGVVWNKFFRMDIIRKFQLRFPENLDWCEDFQFNLEYLQYTKKIYVLKRPIYNYVKTKGSLSSGNAIWGKVIKTKMQLFQYYKELYQSLDLYEKNRLCILSFMIAAATERGKREIEA